MPVASRTVRKQLSKTERMFTDTIIFSDDTLVLSKKQYTIRQAAQKMFNDTGIRIHETQLVEWHVRYWFDLPTEFEDWCRIIAWKNEKITNFHTKVRLLPLSHSST